MEHSDFLSPKVFKAVKNLWILLAVLIVVDFAANYFYPEKKTSSFAAVLDFLSDALACLLFSWYFIINKRWRSFFILLPFLIISFFFMKDLRDMLDYYLPFEKLIDSATLRKYTYLIVELAVVFILSKRYLMEENIEGQWSFLKLFLLNLGFFSLYNTDLGMIEQLISSASFNSKTSEFIVTGIYYLLSSVRTVAFLGAFLFLTACVAKRENIYHFATSVLQFANRHFWITVFIAISCLLFLFGYLFENAISLELDFFGKDLTVFGWLNHISVIAFFVICSRFVGQLLKERSVLKQKYYGVVGSSVWIPVINIISLLMIKFDDKIKFLSPVNLDKARKIHLIIASFLILFVYRKDLLDDDRRIEGLLFSAIYIAALWIVAYLKKYNWIFPSILALIVTVVKIFPFYKGFTTTEFIFKDYALDLVKHTFSIAMILTTIVFYGIYYIAFQSLKKD